MFEVFPAEPHLKHSIRSLKVEQHIIHATFYRRPGGNFVFCERKDLQKKRISISEDLKFETGSFICQSIKSKILNNRDETTFVLVTNHSNRCYFGLGLPVPSLVDCSPVTHLVLQYLQQNIITDSGKMVYQQRILKPSIYKKFAICNLNLEISDVT